MTIIDPLHGQLTEVGDHFAILVHTAETVRAARALEAATADIVTLAAAPGADVPRLSNLAPLPEGPLVRIDDLSTRVDTRRRFGETIRGALDAAGLERAAVSVLPVDGLAELDRCRRAVVLRLFPRPSATPARLEPGWIDLAADWVFGDQRSDALVRLRVLGAERHVPAAEAAGVLHACAGARVWCDVVTGEVEGRVRTASISFGAAPHVAIAGGGPRCDDDGLVARYELLREVVTDVAADCAYACIDFEETFAGLGAGLAGAEWSTETGAAANTVVGRLADQYVPDAYAFQLLGPGHLERFDPGGVAAPAGIPIGDHLGVELGAPVDWLITSEVRADVRADGWDALAPLLLTNDEVDRALAAQRAHAGGADVAPSPTPVVRAHGVPAFADIVLDPHPHPRRGTRLTPLELAAWLGGEAHSDDPASVSPVLRRFVRHLGIGLEPDRRRDLLSVLGDLVDTSLGEHDETDRAWELADWLVHGHAARWLRRAGLTESADRLDSLGSIADPATRRRAVALLGAAVVIAGRRLALTVAIAEDHAATVDQIAWDAWEHVAEPSAWTAVSEAIGHAVPADVGYAADRAVAESSRGGHATDTDVTATAWRAARSELAAVAWRHTWERCEAFVHHESTFSIHTALARSLEVALATDELGVEAVIDTADRAVRDALATELGTARSATAFWPVAIDGARTSGADGAAWAEALDATRSVLGPVLYDDAMAVAAGELDRWLRRAPDLVDRAVVAAVAREACTVGARAVAARVAAESLARGETPADAARSAREELAEITMPLVDEAVAMVARLSHHPGGR